jgi:hypothetical protein
MRINRADEIFVLGIGTWRTGPTFGSLAFGAPLIFRVDHDFHRNTHLGSPIGIAFEAFIFPMAES